MELPLDGSQPRALLPASRNMYSPAWSPSRRSAPVFPVDRRAGGLDPQREGGDRPSHGDASAIFRPGRDRAGISVFSPDGSRFAFAFSNDGPPTIWVEPSVGGPTIRLTSEYIVSPVWSPDGNSIAGLMQREHPWQPALVGVGADMAPRVIPGNITCLTPLAWSPTGEWLACGEGEGITLFSPDGSRRRTLPEPNSSALAFARDGKTLYAAGRAAGRTFLKGIDVAAGSVRDIAQYSDGLTISGAAYQARISLSPDGRSLATSASNS